MSIETELQERIGRLQTAFTAANTAIAGKGGTAADDISGLANAISAIPSGGDVTVETLSVTENGTYTAPTGKAYSPVTVNVPTGSSDPHVIHYTPATRSGTVTLEHGLGYVPTMCVCLCLDLTSGATGKAKNIAACSSFGDANGRTVGFNNSGSMDNMNSGCNINSATETSVTIVGGWVYDAGAEYIFVIN